jgi:hypothetical protein
MITNGSPQEAEHVKLINNAKMGIDAVFPSILDMQTCYRRPVDPCSDTGLLIRSVVLFQAMEHHSIATRDSQRHRTVSLTGIFMLVLAWALAMRKELLPHVVDAQIGMRMAFRFLLHLILKNVLIRTPHGTT